MNGVFHWYNLIGLAGVFLTLAAYFLLSIEKLSAVSLTYSLLNVVGSIMILTSLMYEWNISAFMMEICWMLISVYGTCKAFLMRRQH